MKNRTRLLVIALLSFAALSPSPARAGEKKEFDPMELRTGEPEKPATEAQMRPGLSKATAACLKDRQDFVKKYKAVKEKPAATCACVARALKGQKSLELLDDAVTFYDDGPEVTYGPSREFIGQVQDFCRVDSKWEDGDGKFSKAEIPDFEKKMEQIAEDMTYLVKRTPADKVKEKEKDQEKVKEQEKVPEKEKEKENEKSKTHSSKVAF